MSPVNQVCRNEITSWIQISQCLLDLLVEIIIYGCIVVIFRVEICLACKCSQTCIEVRHIAVMVNQVHKVIGFMYASYTLQVNLVSGSFQKMQNMNQSFDSTLICSPGGALEAVYVIIKIESQCGSIVERINKMLDNSMF